MRTKINFTSFCSFYGKKFLITALMFVAVIELNAQQKSLFIEGVIQDNAEMTIPYVAISIPSKNIGTTSNDDGGFYLALRQSNLQDTLVVSSMGFKTSRIIVADFLKLTNKIIVLREDVNELETVDIKNADAYFEEAMKNYKKTFLNKTHQLNMVYRRTDVQHNISRFLVEHYMSMIMKGPKSDVQKMEVHEVRKSADYRLIKQSQSSHAGIYMIDINPLKDFYTPLKKMKWNKIGSTTFDGEDVVILEGKKDKVKGVGKLTTTLYIGFDTNNIYKIETSAGNCVYHYAKNADGKMYLSYHRREYSGFTKVSALHQKSLGLDKPSVQTSRRFECFVLEVITDKKKMTTKGYMKSDVEMADIKLPYHPDFWKNLSLPPATAFYKKIKEELESNYGVPLETQFKYAN